VYMTLLAYVAALVVYQIGSRLGCEGNNAHSIHTCRPHSIRGESLPRASELADVDANRQRVQWGLLLALGFTRRGQTHGADFNRRTNGTGQAERLTDLSCLLFSPVEPGFRFSPGRERPGVHGRASAAVDEPAHTWFSFTAAHAGGVLSGAAGSQPSSWRRRWSARL
jgi:hypothetical protein